jgi:hypothetical protein
MPMLSSCRASVPRLALMLLPVPSAATAAKMAVVVVAVVVAAAVVVVPILWVSETRSPVRWDAVFAPTPRTSTSA